MSDMIVSAGFERRAVQMLLTAAGVQELLCQKLKEGSFPVRKEALLCLKNYCNGASHLSLWIPVNVT